MVWLSSISTHNTIANIDSFSFSTKRRQGTIIGSPHVWCSKCVRVCIVLIVGVCIHSSLVYWFGFLVYSPPHTHKQVPPGWANGTGTKWSATSVAWSSSGYCFRQYSQHVSIIIHYDICNIPKTTCLRNHGHNCFGTRSVWTCLSLEPNGGQKEMGDQKWHARTKTETPESGERAGRYRRRAAMRSRCARTLVDEVIILIRFQRIPHAIYTHALTQPAWLLVRLWLILLALPFYVLYKAHMYTETYTEPSWHDA